MYRVALTYIDGKEHTFRDVKETSFTRHELIFVVVCAVSNNTDTEAWYIPIEKIRCVRIYEGIKTT